MRLRNKSWTKKYLEEHKKYLIEIQDDKTINLAKVFDNDNQIYALEIGCGKGDFVLGQSLKHPDWNFIAIEKERTILGVALRKNLEAYKQKDLELNNVRFMDCLAENLLKVFEPNSFDYIFLNFSDPWPKTKQYQKRLTYSTFLNIYSTILKPNGIIEFKSDNDNLYKFSLEEIINNQQWEINYQTTDLYKDEEMLIDNIPTEYETRFHTSGKNINKITFKLLSK